MASTFSCKAQTTPFYVGTYTNGDCVGIYQLQFNTETGELSTISRLLIILNKILVISE